MALHKDFVRLAKLIPLATVMTMVVVLMTSNGCGKGFFPEVTPSGSTTTTSTPSSTATAFIFSSNFTDGTLSSFGVAENGALSFVSNVNAGSANGPMGLTVTPDNQFVFVVNSFDNMVRTFSIGSGGIPFLNSEGVTGSAPQQVLVDNSEAFCYTTNAVDQSISEFSILSHALLINIGTVTGFTGTPFGIIEHPSGTFVFVTDSTAGLVYSFSIGNTGQLTQISVVSSNNGTGGNPGLMAIAVDSAQSYLLVDDMTSGMISVFLINSGGGLTFTGSFGTGQSKPIGIAAVNNGGNSGKNFVFTANMTGDFVQPFTRSAAVLTQLKAVADSTGPTGLIIDPTGRFVYTANSGSNTIAQLGINNANCNGSLVCLLRMVDSESPANPNAGTQFLAVTH